MLIDSAMQLNRHRLPLVSPGKFDGKFEASIEQWVVDFHDQLAVCIPNFRDWIRSIGFEMPHTVWASNCSIQFGDEINFLSPPSSAGQLLGSVAICSKWASRLSEALWPPNEPIASASRRASVDRIDPSLDFKEQTLRFRTSESELRSLNFGALEEL